MTLPELIIVMALLGLLLLKAIPAYGDFVARHRIVAASADLHTALLYSRSEALKRGGDVIICRSSSTLSENPSCDKGPDTGATGWGVGWMIFFDKDKNRRFSSGDEVLMMHAKVFQSAQEGQILTKPNRHQIEFNGTGQAFATYMSFVIQNPKMSDQDFVRYICVASGGRARVSVSPCS